MGLVNETAERWHVRLSLQIHLNYSQKNRWGSLQSSDAALMGTTMLTRRKSSAIILQQQQQQQQPQQLVVGIDRGVASDSAAVLAEMLNLDASLNKQHTSGT
ncbi:unnamed protein product [Litomosoides sigmodontis]|uniref:Uncharacterized protein n=1 Tax=Litomosoides sigmodontis TaxID=42156 RepID=A0A3P6STJ3_LITSI|nr:unnamed protein product [Litomosoides sigmodontis]